MKERVKERADLGLLDRAGVMRTLGVSRAAAEAWMRQLPKVEIDGLRKTYVKRRDLEKLVEDKTRAA